MLFLLEMTVVAIVVVGNFNSESPLQSLKSVHDIKFKKTRPIRPVGPYFLKLADKARQSGHPYDRFRLYSEINEVFGAEGGAVVPGCHSLPGVPPDGGWDSLEETRKDLLVLFENGDSYAGYLLGSPSTLEIAYRRGDPYAALHVLGRPSGERTTAGTTRPPDQIKEIEMVLKKLETRANVGDINAMYRLALASGYDKGRADRWYNQLLQTRDRLAYLAMYYRGVSCFPRDGRLVLEAAKQGEVRAMSRLAEHYYYGSEPFSGVSAPDLEQAWFWLRKFREAVGCPPPEQAPPVDVDTGMPWRMPKSKRSGLEYQK